MPERFIPPAEKVEYVLLPKAFERAQKLKADKMKGRDLDDFVGGPVTREVIQQYKDAEAEYDRIFEQKNQAKDPESRQKSEHSKALADCLEGIFLNTPAWFGATSHLYPTTKWDDYRHGVDMVAERKEGDLVSHHGFALDITYAGPKAILKKVAKIADKIISGKLGHVDFFKSGDGKYKGQLGEIPLVVVGADGNTMRGMVNQFAQLKDAELAKHPFQFQMIEQVLMQCDFYIEVAARCPDVQASKRIIEAYSGLKKEFELVLKLKEKTLPEVDRSYRDTFHENLAHSIDDVDKLIEEKYGERIVGNENL